mgnify:FL=1
MGRKVAFAVLAVVLIYGALVFADKLYRSGDAPMPASVAMQEVPDAELTAVGNGKKVKLSSFRGKALLVNFWASWCEACMEEMPTIVKLHKTLRDSGFEVVSINVDEDPEKVVPTIIKKFGMEFPVYVDHEEKLAAAFHVVAIPYNIVMGKDHKVSWSESGERDWASEVVLKKIRALMK